MALFTAGQVVTAAQLNGYLGSWTAYTPTTTGITLGNGTVTGRWTGGKTIDFQCTFTFGSTSAVTASPTFTLPFTALNANWAGSLSTIFDTSASNYYPVIGIADTTARVLCRVLPGTAGINYAAISSTNPMPWATGDVLTIQGRYEIP